MANYSKGENNSRAKLTVEKVRTARVEYEMYHNVKEPLPGKHNNRAVSIAKLAKAYRVGVTTMQLLLKRKTWRFV